MIAHCFSPQITLTDSREKNKKIKQVTETTAEGRGKNNKGEKIAVRSNLKAIQSQYNETTRSYKRI